MEKMDSNSETLKQNKEDMEKMDKKMDSNSETLKQNKENMKKWTVTVKH